MGRVIEGAGSSGKEQKMREVAHGTFLYTQEVVGRPRRGRIMRQRPAEMGAALWATCVSTSHEFAMESGA